MQEKVKMSLKHFLNISIGSLAETEYLIEFSKRLKYIKEDISEVEKLVDEVGKLLWSFYKSI